MSFSVHNADLHMTNVNTVEDKSITPPSPVIVIRAMKGERCVCARVWKRVQTLARVTLFFFFFFYFLRGRAFCVRLKAGTKSPSGLSR